VSVAGVTLNVVSAIRNWPAEWGLCALLGDATGVGVIGEPATGVVTLDDALAGSCAEESVGLTLPVHVAAIPYEHGAAIEPAADAAHAVRRLTDRRLQPKQTLRPIVQRIERGHVSRAGEWKPIGVEPPHTDTGRASYRVGPFASRMGRPAYELAVSATVEAIHAGDIFQANIAHPLEARFEGDARAAAADLMQTLGPGFGAYLEDRSESGELKRIVISVSPELFLRAERNADGITVTTRPIKGTRPATAASSGELEASAKDHAELAMIVDLMRNDLGRVAKFGSVRVTQPRVIERHHAGSIDHAVATVSAVLRDHATLSDLMNATFPPGSITGAPKIRAMQIIDELETDPRGFYCGTIALLAPTLASMSVAIRTLTIECEPGSTPTSASGTITLPVGAGIVADSAPSAEWLETLDKARPIARALKTTIDGDAS
jgi:anthranilate/para-aminobenzoate synthase component I